MARHRVRGAVVVAVLAVMGGCEPASVEPDRTVASPSSTSSIAPEGSAESSPSTAAPAETSEEPEEGTRLLFLRGRVLRSFDLDGGVQEPVATLPTGDAVLSPDGGTVAVVAPAIPTGNDEDFLEYPELRTIELGAGARATLGPGFSPLWSPEGDLAWLEPVERRACDGEVCSGRVRVKIAERGGPPLRFTPPGHWGLLGWAGSRLLVADQSDTSSVLSLSPDGVETALEIPPSEIWGGSPDGRWLVQAEARATRMRPLDGSGAFTGRGTRVDLDGAALAQGTWAPDSSMVAGVAIRASSGGIPVSTLITISTDEPLPSVVPGSRRATGNVIWSPDSSVFAYVQATGPGGGRLTARMCDLGGECRDLFHWTQGVTLLALR